MKARQFRLFANILVTLLVGSSAYCQHRDDAVLDAITAQLVTTKGLQFEAEIMVSVALEEGLSAGRSSFTEYGIDDPYGTLADCVIFIASSKSNPRTKLAGIYKGTKVLWISDTLRSGNRATIFATRDLNLDGLVDIIVILSESAASGMDGISQVWIYSWDGMRGSRINEVDSKGVTTIIVADDALEMEDLDGDAVLEFRSEESADGLLVWSWNGQLYGHWGTSPIVPIISFLPARSAEADVACRVEQSAQGLKFMYRVHSRQSSRRRIKDFLVDHGCLDTLGTSPSGWYFVGAGDTKPIGWHWIMGDNRRMISSSHGIDSFVVVTQGMPRTGMFYVQSERGSPTSEGNPSFVNDFAIDYLNSFQGHTIAPYAPPQPFSSTVYLDTLVSLSTQSRVLGWITDQPTADKYLGYFASSRTHLQQNNVAQARGVLQQVLQDVDADSSGHLTSEAYALIRFNTEYLLSQLPSAPPPGLVAKLVSSTGSVLTSGSLQYYEGSWKDAVNNGDGTFRVNTSLTSLSLRMTYAFGSQTLSNVAVGPDTVVFRTTKVRVRLQNSSGSLIDTGSVQYYASAWRSFGTTVSGIVEKELLPTSYSFRMTYAYGNNDKQQNIGTDPVVVFSTVRADVELRSSQGALIDQGTVQYYAGAWRSFGTTSGGIASKELLPASYSFRMTHDYVPLDKAQNISASSVMSFSTVSCTIRVSDAQNQPVNGAIASYYSGAWRTIGPTVNGEIRKELLPTNLTFRIASGGSSYDKIQNLATGSVVEFHIP